MTGFLFRKMWNCKWLMLCLLFGNILMIGIVAAVPLYNAATLTRVLQADMRSRHAESNAFPATAELTYRFNAAIDEDWKIGTYHAFRVNWLPEFRRDIGIPEIQTLRTDTIAGWVFNPVVNRDSRTMRRTATLLATEDLLYKVRITYGRLPYGGLTDGNTIEVIATEHALHRNDLLIDEPLYVTVGGEYLTCPVGNPLLIRVVGIFEPEAAAFGEWATLGTPLESTLLFDRRHLDEWLIPYYIGEYNITTRWVMVFDYNQMTSAGVRGYMEALRDRELWIGGTFTYNFYDILTAHIEREDHLSLTLLILQLPLFVIISLFMYMVSRQILKLEQNSISVAKSRGADRSQILGIYIMQSLLITIVSVPAGLFLGVQLCRIIGSASGFLELVRRAPLHVVFTREVYVFAAVATLYSIGTMLLPVIRFSKITIITHKLSKTGKPMKPFWQRYFLDVVCLGISVYSLYNFVTLHEVQAGSAIAYGFIDPFLLIGSSLFVIGAGLFCLRLFPYIVHLIYVIGRRFWPPSLYSSLLNIVRSVGEEQFIMIFLVFTLAMGIFGAQTARTVNLNNDHVIRYRHGADIVFFEEWEDNTVYTADPDALNTFIAGEGPMPRMERRVPTGETHAYTVPSFERFTSFGEVASLTRVYRQYVSVTGRQGFSPRVDIMGIETNTFGETVWFRDDLLPAHINDFLNVLAENPDGVILSANFREAGLYLNDTIALLHRHPIRGDVTAWFRIVGFADHWPSFESVGFVGESRIAQEQFMAVANLGFLQRAWGVLPYHVWMRTNGYTAAFFRDFAVENQLPLIHLADAQTALIEMRNDPMVQGLNGILTVNFLITITICFVGFLIYWILSIRSRLLQLGVFRAMGMSMKGIVAQLVAEQLLVTFTALGIGALVGEVAARNFVPLIQMAYTAAEIPIPLLIVVEARDYIHLYTVVGVMILLCLCILTYFLSKMQVHQVLKLGED